MNVNNKTVVVTGAARGIGKALALRFATEGARVVVADRLFELAQETAAEIDGLAVACDVVREADIQHLVSEAQHHFGPIDLFCSNAGVCFGEPGTAASASNEQWQTCWDVHVMAHVYAARAALPGMIERGAGYFLQMVSAAGVLNQIGDAAYSTTKHAALGFAEALAITHGDEGIKVSAICPQYVATAMLGYGEEDDIADSAGLISPQQVADAVIAGLEEERFLILPHAEVEQYRQRKGSDYDRWVSGMRRLRAHIIKQLGSTRLEEIHKLV
ncbi:MAG: SDR family oxidoreductase [Pseudomonadota bacterium]|jgi:NAD(P)-dependent dehydrogenase (short-subunit alcohol dehydrogenase family)|nr:SDR family oxidoreductase [Pseudomonadota bacterium]